MGLKFEKIHACKNDCILFRGDYEANTECPKCGTSRYKRRTEEGGDDEKMRRRVPRKVAWYFPIIPGLKQLFATSRDARLLTWHSDGRTVDDYICHQQMVFSGGSLIFSINRFLMSQGIFGLH